MKHSSGPWEVRPVDSRQPQLAIFQTGARKSSGRIATVPLRDGMRDLCTRDAMLIAAAPDLLEALASLAAVARVHLPKEYDAAIRQAYSTIERAKGEQE